MQKKLYLNISMDSYMVPKDELGPESFKLLEVDNALLLPYRTTIRFVFTGADVIHS